MRLAKLPPELRAFLKQLGVEAEDHRRGGPTWDGQRLHIRPLRFRWHLLHELAHHIAAPAAVKHLQNFGLGYDPDTRRRTPRLRRRQLRRALNLPAGMLTYKTHQAWFSAQEAAAAFLSAVLVQRFGDDWEREEYVLTYLNPATENLFLKSIEHLHRLGIDWQTIIFGPPQC